MAKTLSNIIKAMQPEMDLIFPLSMDRLEDKDEGKVASFAGEPDHAQPASGEEEMGSEGADQSEERSYAEGFNAGREEGLEIGRNEVRPVVESFMASLEALAAARESLYRDAERDIASIVVAAVRKVIQKELEIDTEMVARVIKNALNELSDTKEVLILVSRPDYFYLLEHKERLFAQDGNLRNFRFREDDSVGSGGCIIESGRGEVDARIERQLEKLKEVLEDAISHERE